MKRVIAYAVAISLVAHGAFAQDAAIAGLDAATTFAPTTGPVATDFHIFAHFYDALFTPFQAAVHSVIAALCPYMLATIGIGVTTILMLWAMAIALGAEETGAIFNKMIVKILLPGFVVVFLLQAGNYEHWTTDWISKIPDDIGRIVTGGLGQPAVNGGDPFDNVFNKAFKGGAKAFKALPISLRGAILALIVILYWIAAALSVVIAFAEFAASKVLMELVKSISPIFVGLSAFPQTRFLLKGFVSGVAGIICSQILIVALLAIAFFVENQLLTPVIDAPDNANIVGMLVSVLLTGCVLGGCSVLAVKIPGIAVGLCGGVFDGFDQWVAAGRGAGRGVLKAGRGVRGLVPA